MCIQAAAQTWEKIQCPRRNRKIKRSSDLRGDTRPHPSRSSWNRLEYSIGWTQANAAQRSVSIIQERKMDIENARITKAVQQDQQGQWTTWDESLQRPISWRDIWGMPPLRLSFVIRSLYDQLPSRDNL